jgi:eukaryotic-like serine/threonine-protein kinase
MNEENAPSALSQRASDLEQHALESLRAALGDDFDIVRMLGKGSMATVYLAQEKALGRLVAVKVLLPGRANDETARRRFEREAKAAASLVHPNVVQVFRFGRLPDQTPYLVMRFVKGRTAEERLKAEGQLPADQAKNILADVTSALSAAHAQGIVHRDVRPANILWDEADSSAHLADFGIAALLATGGEEATRLTRTGQMVGNPRYLSPEQLLDHDLTELADMYAVGVLGYELYTGDGPYDAKTDTQWITAHLSADPKDIRALRPEIDPNVADLLKRCLNREPNHRPSASDASRLLKEDIVTSGGHPAYGSGSVEDVADLQQLLKRRVPQIVLLAIGVAIGFVQVVAMLREMWDLPQVIFDVSLFSAVCGIAGATIIAWFHGEKGKQKMSILEGILLSLIVVIWLGGCSWMLIAP